MSAADPRVFGRFYILRSQVSATGAFPGPESGHACPGCGHRARPGEWWGAINSYSHCGACCDAEEARQQ